MLRQILKYKRLRRDTINYNGILTEQSIILSRDNRAFNYGDGLFETIKIHKKNICFFEDHYFRLMASMRMLRMEIPMNFTLEFLEKEIEKLIKVCENFENGKVRLTIFRKDGRGYLPENQEICYLIVADQGNFYPQKTYAIDLFKDYLIPLNLLSNIKSTNRILNVLSSIFAKENQVNQSVLLNQQKRLVEVSNGNIFLVKKNLVKTPPIEEGCINGIARKKIIALLEKDPNWQIQQLPISPFELQTCDEIFVTNAIIGVQGVTRYRKKRYTTEASAYLYQKWLKTL